MQIQKLQQKDIKDILGITPESWGNGATIVFQTHWNQPYFFPIKLIVEHKMIGVAELIVNKKIGWLGNIIVKKEYRNQGFGKKLTEELMKIAKERGCESIYLIATSLGKYVYEKLGFQEKGKYFFFETDLKNVDVKKSNNIIRFQEEYRNQVFEMDKKAMGEDRSEILKLHFQDTYVYKKEGEENISGFFMPKLGNGLTICNNEIASFDFIKEREQMGLKQIAFPKENKSVLEYVRQRGYHEWREVATFMFLGKMKTWNPEMVTCRIGGYVG